MLGAARPWRHVALRRRGRRPPRPPAAGRRPARPARRRAAAGGAAVAGAAAAGPGGSSSSESDSSISRRLPGWRLARRRRGRRRSDWRGRRRGCRRCGRRGRCGRRAARAPRRRRRRARRRRRRLMPWLLLLAASSSSRSASTCSRRRAPRARSRQTTACALDRASSPGICRARAARVECLLTLRLLLGAQFGGGDGRGARRLVGCGGLTAAASAACRGRRPGCRDHKAHRERSDGNQSLRTSRVHSSTTEELLGEGGRR